MSRSPEFAGALVLTGGGTGGHYFPAVALAEGARRRWPELPIAFVGACRGIEARKLPESDWPHVLLDVEGLMGRSPMAMARGLWKLRGARCELIQRWRKDRPLAVVGTGGYGAAPALLAARHLGIPMFLHESNAAPGALIRWLAGSAQRVWLGMGEAASALPKADCRVVGTPVREVFLRGFRPFESLEPPYQLLVMGGSGGARPLNEAILAEAPELLERFPDWTLLHQAGPTESERLRDVPRHPRHTLVPFLEQMDAVMEASSLVLSRSGASTCAELMACGRPAVLVPFPQAAGDHQRVNALAMAGQGRAEVVLQGQDLGLRLREVLGRLMGDGAARGRLCRPEPNRSVAHCLDDLVPWLP